MNLVLAAFIPLIASLVNLNEPGYYITFGVISISVANFIVIVLMVAVFFLAMFLPFPGKKEHRR